MKSHIQIILLVILGALVYSNAINGQFLLDDDVLVKNNALIKNYSNIAKIFKGAFGEGELEKREGALIYYRPLQQAINMVGFSLFELREQGYHAVSIALHILVALCIYWLIYILFSDRLISFLTSVLFIVHPVQVEAVAYISGMGDPLALFFMLISYIFFIKYLDSGSAVHFLIFSFGYILGLFSKESALIFLPLASVYIYLFKGKFKEGRLQIFFLTSLAITFVYILVRTTILKASLLHLASFFRTPITDRLLLFFAAVSKYVSILMFPMHLHMDYGNQASIVRVIIGATVLIACIVFAFKNKNKNKIISFSLFWCLLAIVPASGLFYYTTFFTMDHYLYISSVGFFLIVSQIMAVGIRRKEIHVKIFFGCLIASLVFCLALISRNLNRSWSAPINFYSNTLKYNPVSLFALNNLALEYFKTGNNQKAVSLLKAAIAFNDRDKRAYMNMGFICSKTGRSREAVQFFSKALEIDETDALAYARLGNVHADLRDYPQAIMNYQKAIALDKQNFETYYNLGTVYGELGQREASEEMYEKAIELNPDFIDAYNNLADIFIFKEKYSEAENLCLKALMINSDHPLTRINLARIYYYQKKYDLALKHCDAVLASGYALPSQLLESLNSHRK